jgi:hypothetical protein
MSVDTKLYIGSQWEIRDIINIIQSRLGVDKITTSRSSDPLSECLSLLFQYNENDRSMFVFPHAETPLGSSTMLSLGHNKDAITIMTAIADAIGGLLQPQDFNESMEMIQGNVSTEDGLPYFVNDMIINRRPAAKSDRLTYHSGYTLPDLNNHIKEWSDKIGTNAKEKLKCF